MAGAAALSQPLRRLRPGDTFTTAGRTVTEADIVTFSTLTGDLHPLHVDAEWSAGTGFGERIAPGALVLAYAIGLVRLDPERAIALRGITDVVFARPVRIGDTLSVDGRLAEASPSDAGTSILSIVLTVLNQERKTVCRARLQVKWRDDSPPADRTEEEPKR